MSIASFRRRYAVNIYKTEGHDEFKQAVKHVNCDRVDRNQHTLKWYAETCYASVLAGVYLAIN